MLVTPSGRRSSLVNWHRDVGNKAKENGTNSDKTLHLRPLEIICSSEHNKFNRWSVLTSVRARCSHNAVVFRNRCNLEHQFQQPRIVLLESLRRSCVGVREMLKDACTPMDIIRYHVYIYLTKKLVLVLNLFSIVLMEMIIREALHFP